MIHVFVPAPDIIDTPPPAPVTVSCLTTSFFCCAASADTPKKLPEGRAAAVLTETTFVFAERARCTVDGVPTNALLLIVRKERHTTALHRRSRVALISVRTGAMRIIELFGFARLPVFRKPFSALCLVGYLDLGWCGTRDLGAT